MVVQNVEHAIVVCVIVVIHKKQFVNAESPRAVTLKQNNLATKRMLGKERSQVLEELGHGPLDCRKIATITNV